MAITRHRQLILWSERYRELLEHGDVYVYFNNDQYGFAVKNALDLKRLSGRLNSPKSRVIRSARRCSEWRHNPLCKQPNSEQVNIQLNINALRFKVRMHRNGAQY